MAIFKAGVTFPKPPFLSIWLSVFGGVVIGVKFKGKKTLPIVSGLFKRWSFEEVVEGLKKTRVQSSQVRAVKTTLISDMNHETLLGGFRDAYNGSFEILI